MPRERWRHKRVYRVVKLNGMLLAGILEAMKSAAMTAASPSIARTCAGVPTAS